MVISYITEKKVLQKKKERKQKLLIALHIHSIPANPRYNTNEKKFTGILWIADIFSGSIFFFYNQVLYAHEW